MPKRKDIKSILIIGSGPIVIGQACEFDYSGTQACKALREEGFRIILVNSNPATIMTDPEMADRTYIEPITAEAIAKIIEKERPDALLPTLGGQTALNTAMQLNEMGALDKFGVELIGANCESIAKAEDRSLFKKAMVSIGLDVPRSGLAYNMKQAREIRDEIGLPCVIRPAFTLGGSGGGIAYNVDEFETIAEHGIELSMIGEILVEESVIGWKEFELEVMRDKNDNVVIICSIENLDPMGVHTGDSITVAPAQTLTDREYQYLRDASIKIIREIGVETGGSNIQFAVDPKSGRVTVIEMNPRVSRSSALASKATGFPIAKIAAKLAVGYTLDEISNDITQKTPASFEPTIDYCVVKIPRFAFEKFAAADPTLTTQMKSVGEVMAIGRTFKEAIQKAIRSLELRRFGLGLDRSDLFRQGQLPDRQDIFNKLKTPNCDRLYYIRYGLRSGLTVDDIAEITHIDPWFLDNLAEIVEFEDRLIEAGSLESLDTDTLREAKQLGFSNVQLAETFGIGEDAVRTRLQDDRIEVTFKLVDTCAAEFEAYTPYYYSTYESECEARVSNRRRIMILGGGPNRIGQGIEFDYCCVHAAYALSELDYETVMVNSNPETVSTDFDTSDLLFFEPLTHEDVLNICRRLEPEGVIIQFGGQTPLNLCAGLAEAKVPILGTTPESIDRAEDRERFKEILAKVGLRQPENGVATNVDEAIQAANLIGYPVIVRPSYVLGGRAMEIVYNETSLRRYVTQAVDASPEHPILIDQFLEDAIEVDVDAIGDGERIVVGGIMEHIEEAGIHSGDSTCSLPPFSLGNQMLDEIRQATHRLGQELGICGLMNIQFAIKNRDLYVLEVNPRASRTVPFVSKAIGVPLAKLAAQVMVGKKLDELGFTEEVRPRHVSVKEPVFPFNKFPGVDPILSPEMRSTGEVMGIDREFGAALAKARMASSQALPLSGKVLITVKDSDKSAAVLVARRLHDLGFHLIATHGTYKALEQARLTNIERIAKVEEGRPNVLDTIINRDIGLIINTPSGQGPRADDAKIRAAAVEHRIPMITTLSGARAALSGIESLIRVGYDVKALQDYHI
ncbi:MAG: carbamoyl-phosphate synthase large subunit [Planctomycetota bacterium]